MISPYKQKLKGFEGMRHVVTIHRADAPDLKGKVKKVDDYGCTIHQPTNTPGGTLDVFVTYEDIRGVGTEGTDPDID